MSGFCCLTPKFTAYDVVFMRCGAATQEIAVSYITCGHGNGFSSSSTGRDMQLFKTVSATRF